MADANAVGEAFISLRYRMDHLDSDLRAVTGKLGKQLHDVEVNAGKSGERTGKSISGGLGRALTGVQGQLAAVGGALAGLSVGRSIVATNTEFERLGAALKTVTGSAEAGQEQFNKLVDFAATTPSSLQEVTEAFLTLKARGIDTSLDALTSFGNTAAAMGKPLGQFAEAVADAITGEFERLKEFGISASKDGDQLALTFQGVTTRIGANAEEIGAYLRQIGETKFAGAMTEQMNTLDGLFSNLGDSFDALSRRVGEAGLNKGMKDLLQVFLDTNTAAGPLAEQLGSVLGGALSALAEGLGKVLRWYNELSPSMQEFVTKVGLVAGVLAAGAPLAIGLGVIVGLLSAPVTGLIAVVAAAGAAYLTFKDEIHTFVSEATGRLRTFWDQQLADFRAIGEAFGVTGEDLASFKARLVALPDEAGPRLTTFWEQQKADLRAIGEAFGIGRGDIDAFKAHLAALPDEVGPRLTAFWEQQKADLLSIGEAFGVSQSDIDAFKLKLTSIPDEAGPRLASFWEAQKQELLAVGEALGVSRSDIDAFKAKLTSLPDEAGPRLTAFWAQQKEELLAIGVALSEAGGRVKAFWDQQVADFNAAAEALSGAGSRISAFWQQQLADYRAFADGMKAAGERVSTFWEQQKKELSEFVEDPSGALGKAAEGIRAQWSKMIGGVESETKKLDASKDKIDDFTYGTTTGFANMEDAVTGHSYYPDMVNAIIDETGRLQGGMVQPLGAMLGQATGNFERFGQDASNSVAQVGQAMNAAVKVPANTNRAGGATARQYGGGESGGQDGAARRERIDEINREIAQLQRLNAAQGISAEEYARVKEQIDGENFARQLGLDAKSVEGQAIANLAIQQDRLTASLERAKQIQDAEQEASDAQRLAEAQLQGVAARDEMARAIYAEQAARELGAEAGEAEIDRYVRAKLAAEDFAASEARTARIQTLQEEVSELQRLSEAEAQGEAAYHATALAIEQERAVRELGIGATKEEIAATKELIATKYELANAPDPTVMNAGAGANRALEEYVMRSREHGRIAGEAIAGGLGIAEDGLKQFLMTGKFTFADLEKSLERFKEILIEIAAQQIIAGLVGGMFGGGMMGAGAGAAMGGRRYAKGGVVSGPGISAYSGSIVRSPTVFPFARGIGLMGEAGPEAILPLKRGASGRLGVEVAANDTAANDAGPRVTVQVFDQRQGGAPVQQQTLRSPDGSETIRLMIRDEVRRTIASGDADRAMQRYGNRPQLHR